MYAAENSISPFYVTEKVFHGLVVGAVPVYFGTRDVFDYVPDHSIIYVEDHEDLAAYLHDLSKNRTAYNEYLEWRYKPLPERVITKLNASKLRIDKKAYWRSVCVFIWSKLKKASENNGHDILYRCV